MSISRLDNFLRNPSGTIIYVDPNNFDATDSFKNRGDSLTRPFKTIQRALIEAARFSYVPGIKNDLNDNTTVLVYPGTYYIDNRPGLSIEKDGPSSVVYRKRTSPTNWSTGQTITEFNENSNFDIFNPNNDLYKFNSIEGGIILPRGTSIVGLDLRKTKIRPLYVPDPEDNLVERSSYFKVTGNCYFTAFTFFDADPNTPVYKNYADTQVTPLYSHHKLTTFTYADGTNKVVLADRQIDLTDLQMYYYKVSIAYGGISGRNIPDFPIDLGFEPVQNEYEIVGDLSGSVLGISTIRAGNGDGTGDTSIIRIQPKDLNTGLVAPHKLTEGKAISISGITQDSYNGSFVVLSIISETAFTVKTSTPPQVSFSLFGSQLTSAIIKISSDAVQSSSPYIFNCSLRSTCGVCGVWADGAKSTGFKSMVIAQFTGISLQKDENAFAVFNENSYVDNSTIPSTSELKPLHTNSKSIYKPEYENFHIRVSNDAFIQCVSVFAIGFSKHFLAESGGDMSITNSNSNFGSTSLESVGFKNKAFNKDDVGYITHIIPPKYEIETQIDINWFSINIGLTTETTNSTNRRLYLNGFNDINSPPNHKIDGYRIGAQHFTDKLYIQIPNVDGDLIEYSSPITMPIGATAASTIVGIKSYQVSRVSSINQITNNIITLIEPHNLLTGESVRVFSNSGILPFGLEADKLYYVIRRSTTEISLAESRDNALIPGSPVELEIGNQGGTMFIQSSVSDKLPGELGHPIQWDSTVENWYINSTNGITNQIYTQLGLTSGQVSPTTYFRRFADSRSTEDRIFKFRYCIPKEYSIAREPEPGFVVQESGNVFITPASFNSDPFDIKDGRNERIISNITATVVTPSNTQTITAITNRAHKFVVGDKVKIQNVRSVNNPTGLGQTSTYNGTFIVNSTPSPLSFTYTLKGIQTNPGTFTNSREKNSAPRIIPVVSKEEYKNNFYIYKVETIRKHIPDQRDGVYHLTILCSNVSTETGDPYGFSNKLFNQDVRDLYPMIDRDNLIQNPRNSFSTGSPTVIGKVNTSSKKHSITRESTLNFLRNNQIGFTVSNISNIVAGTPGTFRITTDINHGLAGISSISIQNPGSNYTPGEKFGIRLVKSGSTTDATCNYTIDPTGIVSTIDIVDPGSAFIVGDTLQLEDTPSSGGTPASFRVEEIYNNVGNSISLDGFEQDELNNVFRITSIPSSTQIQVENWTNITSYTANVNSSSGIAIHSCETIGISSIFFRANRDDVVEVRTTENHNLFSGNQILITNTGNSLFDNKYHVIIRSLTPSQRSRFYFNLPKPEIDPGVITTGVVLKHITSPNFSATSSVNENIGSRMNFIYSGDSTDVGGSNEVVTGTATIVRMSGMFDNSNRFKKGDYIQIQDEILRLVSVGSDVGNFEVLRGQFGTPVRSITNGSLVRKIIVVPIELRRPSSLRASGHTFEYLGYGPGNYSTAMPQNQDRKLDGTEVLLSQAKKLRGGSIVYDGLNDLGESYFGNKKTISSTGEDVLVSAPIVRYVGDDVDGSDSLNLSSDTFDNLTVRNRIVVEGGSDKGQFSIFNGPVRVLGDLYLGGGIKDSGGADYRASTSKFGLVRLATVNQIDNNISVGASNSQIDQDANRAITLLGLNRWKQKQRLVSLSTGLLTIYVKSGTPNRNLNTMLDIPPTDPANAVPTIQRAAEYVNEVIGGGNRTARIAIAPGLYNPTSEWNCNVEFWACNPAENETNPNLPRWKLINTETGNGNDPSVDFTYFQGEGYGERGSTGIGTTVFTHVNFRTFGLRVRSSRFSNNNLEISANANQITCKRGVDFRGGFHFLGIPELIKLVSEGFVQESEFLTIDKNSSIDPNIIIGSVGFTTNTTTNVDTLLKEIILKTPQTNGAVGLNSSFTAFTSGSPIRLEGVSTDVAEIRGIVFGSALPSRKEALGGSRPPYIATNGIIPINLSNIYLRGNTTITSVGIGVSNNLPEANQAHYGSSVISSSGSGWTWKQFHHTFIGPILDEPILINSMGDKLSYEISGNNTNIWYKTSDGLKYLPNHIHLLTIDGLEPTNNDSGPFLDQFIHAKTSLIVRSSFLTGNASGLTTEKTSQGFVGKFGSNGYNSTKTRGVLLGNVGFLDEERSATILLGVGARLGITGSNNTELTIFKVAGLGRTETTQILPRYSVNVGLAVTGETYTILSIGDMTNANWNTFAGTSGVSYPAGTVVKAVDVATSVGIGKTSAFIQPLYGEPFPIGTPRSRRYNPIITTPASNQVDPTVNPGISTVFALNMALRSYARGISPEHGFNITPNVVL
jgi:hypothetical protein